MANTHLARLGFWARTSVAAVIAVGLSEPLFAVECPAPQVTGNVAIGDGSHSQTGGAAVNGIGGYLPGSITVNNFPGPGTYSFHGTANGYLDEDGGSATCWFDAQPCLQCSGSFSLTFYSKEGAIDGFVAYSPDGAPAVWAEVDAIYPKEDPHPYGHGSTNAVGWYEIRSQATANNWGLILRRDGTSGPGHSTFEVYPAGHQLLSVDVSLTSNQLGHANFVIPRPDAEEPPRCNAPSPQSPGPSAGKSTPACSGAPTAPCTVGGPVSVTTGNVDVDQTDAVVPGRGLGLRFSRSYNSANSAIAERYGVFGPGWNHSYEKRLTFLWVQPGPPVTTTIKLRNSDGTITYFAGTDANGYKQTAPYSNDSWIEKTPSSNLYVRHFLRGGQEVYDRLTPSGTTARLTSLSDAVGTTTLLTYDVSNKLTTIADPGGRQLTLGYVGAELRTLTGPAGLIATYAYETFAPGSVRLSGVTYADGNADAQPDGAYTFAYHASGNGAGKLWTVTDGSGRVTETQIYDALGRAIETSISGNVRKYTLDYQADKTVVTDSLGNETEYQFQTIWGAKRITRTIGSCSGCGGGGNATQEWGYDQKGRVTSHTDGEGNVTEYTYDDEGNLERIEGPVMEVGPRHVTEMEYDASGRLVSRTAPNLAATTWTHVAAGPATITEEVSPGVTRTTTFEYYNSGSQMGKLHYHRDPLNRQTEFFYTTKGDLSYVEDPSGPNHATAFQYDLMGRRTKTIPPATTPANDTPTTSYDTLGRVWKVTNPNGSYWQNTYDGGGHRTVARDPAGTLTTYVYDAFGRLSTATNSPGGFSTGNYVTEYRYDEMSNLRYLIDPRQYPQPSPPTTATEFRYEDGHNRVTSVHYPGNLTEEFTYDLAGRLATRTDRKGVETAFTYDALGRLTSKTYSNGSAPVTFAYDAGGDTGFMTGASNSADTLAWDYDGAGQMLSESSTRNGTTVSYQYFLTGERQKLRLNGTDVLTYAYDLDGQLDTLTRAAGVVFDFNTDPAHRRQNVVFPNGTTTEYSYDLLSRTSLIRLKAGATVLNDIAYESNNLNNRTARTENGVRLEYGYDNLSRLKTVNSTLPTTALLEQYTYDQVGNRLSALGVLGGWTYNDRNELTSYNGINFTYDLNGNQQTRSGTPTRTYTWNVDNGLKIVSDGPTEIAKFEYDPLGRRVTKTTYPPFPSGQTRFAYDGEDILFEQGPSGNFTYLHGPGIDEPLARETSTGVRTHYHADGLDSIVKRTDTAGNVVGTQTYDSFGIAVLLPNGYGFTGREWDSESGQDYYRERYYDPKIGRFVSEDPIQFNAGLNFYAYVENNPVNFSDPFGLERAAPRYVPTPGYPLPPPHPEPSAGQKEWYKCMAKRGIATVPACMVLKQAPPPIQIGYGPCAATAAVFFSCDCAMDAIWP